MSKKRTVRGTTRVVKDLNNINKKVAKWGASMVQTLAVEAAEEAKKHIRAVGKDPNFTQKAGVEAIADEVGAVKISDIRWAVAAPTKHKTYEMAENMYFAEYGAGIMQEGISPTPIPKGVYSKKFNTVIWRYRTTADDEAPTKETDAKSRVIGATSLPFKYKTKTRGWVGVTDRSKPLHYMQHARSWLRNNGAKQARKSLQTVLYRQNEYNEDEEE